MSFGFGAVADDHHHMLDGFASQVARGDTFIQELNLSPEESAYVAKEAARIKEYHDERNAASEAFKACWAAMTPEERAALPI